MSSNDVIVRLNAAVGALGDVDVSGWDDSALRDRLAELSTALCGVDAQLSRVADEVRARGFHIVEPSPSLAVASSAAAAAATGAAATAASGDEPARHPVAA